MRSEERSDELKGFDMKGSDMKGSCSTSHNLRLRRIGIVKSGYGGMPEGIEAGDVYRDALERFRGVKAPIKVPRIIMGETEGLEGEERENLARRLGLEWE